MLSGFPVVQPVEQGFVENFRHDGLGDEIIHACSETLILVFGKGIRRQRKNRCLSIPSQLSYVPRRFQPVLYGHLHIHQDDRVDI